jgi:hypothetical protein
MSRPKRDPPEERRADLRHQCHRHCLVSFDRRYLDGQPGSVSAEGYVSDLSASGVGLLLRREIPMGATLAITPFESAPAPLPPAQVVRSVQVGGRWRLGCRLEQRLSEQELRAWLQ